MSPARLLRRQPLVFATLAYLAGIILFLNIDGIDISAAAVFAVGTLGLTLLKRSETLGSALLLLFFLLLGIHSTASDTQPPAAADHIAVGLSGLQDDAVVIGRIRRIFSFTGESVRFDLEAQAIRTEDTDFSSVQGIIRYTLRAPFPASIIPGETVLVRARLHLPHRFATPGAFDYRAYLARRQIHVIGSVRSPLHIVEVDAPLTLAEHLRCWPERARYAISGFIDATLPRPQAALYKALLTGDRSGVSPATIEMFRNTGTLHVLAISGLHLSLLNLALFSLFFWLLRRSEWLILRIDCKRTAAFLCIFPLLFYTLIAGAQAPVLRAFIMSLIVIVAVCRGSRHSFPPLVSAAVLALLSISPAQLAAVSFQLTFAAVTAIAAASPLVSTASTWMTARVGKTWPATLLSWILAGIIVSLAATLGTAPLIIYHFNHLSTVGMLANLIVEPIICFWSLSLGFVAVIFLFIAPPLAPLPLHLGASGLSAAVGAAAWFTAIPHSSLSLPSPPVAIIVLFYLFFLPLLSWRHWQRAGKCGSAALALLAVGLLFFFHPAEYLKKWRRESRLTYIDVGQGSSSLIEMPGGRRVLIDGGAMSSPGFDIGERVIAPFLLGQGIGVVDDVIVTHPDSDHYNGLPYLLQVMKVTNLYLPVADDWGPGWQRLLAAARRRGVAVVVPEGGDVLSKSASATLEIVANTSSQAPRSSNDTGLVVRYRDGTFAALFPGDISKESERMLVAAGVGLQANVLLAPHHGSDTSNSKEFLHAISPEITVVSAGRRRNLQLPEAQVARRYLTQGCRLLPLYRTGTMSLTTTEKGGYRLDTLLPL